MALSRKEIKEKGYPTDVEKTMIFLCGMEDMPQEHIKEYCLMLAAESGDNTFYQLVLAQKLLFLQAEKGDPQAQATADTALALAEELSDELSGRPEFEAARSNVFQAAAALALDRGERAEAMELFYAAKDAAGAAGADASGIEKMIKEAVENG